MTEADREGKKPNFLVEDRGSDKDMMDLIVKSCEQSGIPLEQLIESNQSMRIDFSKQQVIAFMTLLESENFEISKDLNVAEIELIQLKQESEFELQQL